MARVTKTITLSLTPEVIDKIEELIGRAMVGVDITFEALYETRYLLERFSHTFKTFRPALLAAESCWMSEETKASASNSKAHAICNASRVRTLLDSRI